MSSRVTSSSSSSSSPRCRDSRDRSRRRRGPTSTGVDGFDRFGDALLELVLLDDDRIDAQARLELDVVDGLQVGRIGDAEEQALAAFDQRQHAMLVDQLLVDGANDVEVDLDGVEVEQRYAEFVRRGDGDRARIGQFLVDEVGNQRHFLFLGGFGGLEELLLRDDAVLHEAPWQACEIGL